MKVFSEEACQILQATGRSVHSILGASSIMTFGIIRSPPWTLPIPPCRGWFLCLPLFVFVRVSRHMWFFFCFLLQSLQGRQCLLEISICLNGIVLEPCLFEWSHHLLLQWKYYCSVKWLVWSSSARASHRRRRSSSRWFSIIRLRNSGSRTNRSWIPRESLFFAFLLQLVSRKLLSPGFLPYRCPWGLPFLMTYSGTERSIVYLMNFWLAPLSLCKKCPHVQTLWVLETCLIVGLLPFIIILITALLSSNTYNKASWRADWTFEGTESLSFIACPDLSETRETFPRTETIRSHSSRAGSPSNLNPASKEMISDSVELWETAVCFLHIQLIGTNVLLPKTHNVCPEVDLESSRSPAKSESWNSPSLHCLTVLPTWQYCFYSLV